MTEPRQQQISRFNQRIVLLYSTALLLALTGPLLENSVISDLLLFDGAAVPLAIILAGLHRRLGGD
jgi:hypothetical protein